MQHQAKQHIEHIEHIKHIKHIKHIGHIEQPHLVDFWSCSYRNWSREKFAINQRSNILTWHLQFILSCLMFSLKKLDHDSERLLNTWTKHLKKIYYIASLSSLNFPFKTNAKIIIKSFSSPHVERIIEGVIC